MSIVRLVTPGVSRTNKVCERTYREIGPDTYLIAVMGGTIGWWVFKNIEEITYKTEENKNVTCDGQRRI